MKNKNLSQTYKRALDFNTLFSLFESLGLDVVTSDENSNLSQTISQICQKLGISYKVVESFVDYLYRHNLLVKYDRGQRYSLTLNGLNFLLNLAESCYLSQNFKGESHERGRA
jgi:predicted transcriptional regulator